MNTPRVPGREGGPWYADGSTETHPGREPRPCSHMSKMRRASASGGAVPVLLTLSRILSLAIDIVCSCSGLNSACSAHSRTCPAGSQCLGTARAPSRRLRASSDFEAVSLQDPQAELPVEAH